MATGTGIAIGNTRISDLYSGDSRVSKVYKGTQLIWSAGIQVKSGLIACYEMDSGSGTALVDKHNGINMTIRNSPTWKTNPPALLLNGVNQDAYLTGTNTALNPVSAQSISVWFYRYGDNDGCNGGTLFSRYYSNTGRRIFHLTLYDSDTSLPLQLRYTYYNTSNTSYNVSYTPSTNIWDAGYHHVVATRDSSKLKLYVDGVLQGTSSCSGDMQYAEDSYLTTNIGSLAKSSNIPDYLFKGIISQSAMWNRALTQSEVTDLYGGGNIVSYSNWN